MKNLTPTIWITWKKNGQIPRNAQPIKTES